MWKIGIVGTGYWSEKHIKAWQFVADAEITGICDRHEDTLNEKAEQFNIPATFRYSDVTVMLDNANLDVIDIITPPETHLELVKMAAAAGKHIMCQKPFARSIEEAEEMVRIAEEAGVRLMVTENWRWLEPFQLIKQLLEESTVGQLNTIRYIHTDYYSPRFAPEEKVPQPFLETCHNCCSMRWVCIGLTPGGSCLVSLNVYMPRPERLVNIRWGKTAVWSCWDTGIMSVSWI